MISAFGGELEGAVYMITGKGEGVPNTEAGIDTAFKLTLISKRAKEEPRTKFISLMHLLNAEYLRNCYAELKRGKAAGIDGKVVEGYTEEEITQAIEAVILKLKMRTYRPQPVRRVYIEKGNGQKRPLGIPTVMDKVIQLGVAKILEAIYEPTFLPVSYGFRQGRNAHECLRELNHKIMGQKVNWVIEADIRGFFDHVDHGWMMRCIEEKIGDTPFKKLIERMLKAGIMEEGQYRASKEGTPQGGIISPLLANIYLHYVLDMWFEKVEQKELKGEAYLIRYADDFVVCLQHKEEAQKVLEDIRGRMGKFGLELAEEKTGIVEFGRFAEENHRRRGEGKPGTIEFLGFIHYCTRTRDGRFMARAKTSRKKMSRAIKRMGAWLKSIRNLLKLEEIWKLLKLKLQGHYNYYGLSGNFESIQRYYRKVLGLVFKWLNRRSQKTTWNWSTFREHLDRNPLPKPKLTYAIHNTW
jgi:group II intron reverse transcriptase/maturase